MDRQVVRPGLKRRRMLLGGAMAAGLLAVAAWGGLTLLDAKSSVRVPMQGLTIEAAQPGVFHDFVALRAKVVPKDVFYLDALEGGQVL